MITLSLQPYCHEGCMRFEPRVLRGVSLTDADTTVTCEHTAECLYMMRYLKKHGMEKEKTGDLQ